MKKLMTAGLLMLACLGLNVVAQDGWYHDRMARFQGEQWHMHLFEHVRSDLDFVRHNAPWAAPRERKRLDRTMQELGDLQGKLEGHRFDQGELNDVIDSITKSANDERLSPRDKEVLRDDLNRMRDYRDHHDNWYR